MRDDTFDLQALYYDLRNIISEILQISLEKVHIDTNFDDLGFHSVSLTEFAVFLNEEYGFALTPDQLYSYPSVEELAAYLIQEERDKVCQKYGKSEPQNVQQDTEAKTLISDVTYTAALQYFSGYEQPAAVQRHSDAAYHANTEPIAVIGMSGRFPQARNVEELWEIIHEGKDVTAPLPLERPQWKAAYEGKLRPEHRMGIVPGIAEFDPLFFDISYQEAENMDPRQRLLLMEMYNAMEQACLGKEVLAQEKIGVFVGAEAGLYQGIAGKQFGITSNHDAVLAARIAYFLDLKGPNFTLNTACSSGLVALHEACQAIRCGECDTAIVGAANLLPVPDSYCVLEENHVFSDDGRCHAFDEKANGMVPSEAVAVLVICSAEKAHKDRNRVLAWIRGSGVNYDGKTKGITAPSAKSQSELLRSVYQRSGISTRDISYILTHGTGTRLGDPMEIHALKEAFGAEECAKPYCAVTSVKPNIGHSMAASGLVSCIAMIEAMQHGEIPASIHCEQPNAFLQLEHSPFYLNRERKRWEVPTGKPYLAGVSAFGISGTNAHVILERAEQPPRSKCSMETDVLIPLSAKTKTALRRQIQNLQRFLNNESDVDMASLSYTLLHGRMHYQYRAIFLANRPEKLMRQLEQYLSDGAQNVCWWDGTVQKDEPVRAEQMELGKMCLEQLQNAGFESAQRNAALGKIGKLFCEGCEQYAMAIPYPQEAVFLHLPSYPFELQSYWAEGEKQAAVSSTEQPVLQSEDHAASCVQSEIRKLICGILKTPVQALAANETFERFGFDSYSLIEFAVQLSESFHCNVTPDQLYSYSTIEKLSAYLLEKNPSLQEQCAKETERQPQKAADAVSSEEEKHHPAEESDSVVIVGMSGRFPNAKDAEAFWELLYQQRDVISCVDASRKEWQGVYATEEDRAKRRIGVLSDIAGFEAQFFEISPREAISMDPRQRILLEEMWKALEDAGYSPQSMQQETIGVFVGAEETDYRSLLHEEIGAVSNHNAALAARLAFLLDLHGPNMTINTACSSALLALHQAALSIQNGDCDAAIVAGVNLMPKPDLYLGMEKAGMLSADGTCYAFDKKANGMVPSEAAAVVVLKRGSLARKCGNSVYAAIMGSGTNYDGRTNGITAPSGAAQTALMRKMYQKYQIRPSEIDCIVTHGTGTKLGDPIEINALSEIYSSENCGTHRTALFSVKPNVGHSLAASGLVSLIALLKAMQHEWIPASIHCDEPNPFMQWENSALYLNTKAQKWEENAEKRRIGAVSAFGIAGSNAHLVIASVPSAVTDNAIMPYYLLPFSARTEDSLQRILANYLHYFTANQSVSLSAVSYTLLYGRKHFDERCVLVVRSMEEAIEKLQKLLHGESVSDVIRRRKDSSVQKNASVAADVQKKIEFCQKQHDHADSSVLQAMNAIGEYYAMGYEEACMALFEKPDVLLHLPTYEFVHKRYWPDTDEQSPMTVVKAKTAVQPLPSADAAEREKDGGKIKLIDKALVAFEDYSDVPLAKPVITLSALEEDTVQPEQQSAAIESDVPRGLQMLSDFFEKIYNGELQPFNAESSEVPADPEAVCEKPKENRSEQAVGLEQIVQDVRAMIAEAIYMEPDEIDADAGFHELGIDSVISVDLIQRMNKRYHLQLNASFVYQYPTLMKLSEFICSRLSASPTAAKSAIQRIPQPEKKDTTLPEIIMQLSESLAKELFMDVNEIDCEMSFMELGLDSIISVNWVRQLSKRYGIELSTTQIYQYPNIRQLADHIEAMQNRR